MDKVQQSIKDLNEVIRMIKNGSYDTAEEALIDKYDDNYFGNGQLKFGRITADIESIWTSNDTIMVHVDCKHFEGDLSFGSLSKSNMIRVVETIKSSIYENGEAE